MIDMINNFLAFWLNYCIYIKTIFPLNPVSLSTKIVAIKIKENIISQKIIKKSLKKNITDFLQIPNKLSSQKKKQINKSK